MPTFGLRRTLRTFLQFSDRCARMGLVFVAVGVDCRATHTTEICGCAVRLMVTSVASAPAPISGACGFVECFRAFSTWAAPEFIPTGRTAATPDRSGAVLVDADAVAGRCHPRTQQCQQDVLGIDVVVPQAKCPAEGQPSTLAGPLKAPGSVTGVWRAGGPRRTAAWG